MSIVCHKCYIYGILQKLYNMNCIHDCFMFLYIFRKDVPETIISD